jgi:A/G-specific adenine glycosylase
MDFGATLCTRHSPACAICPLQADCVALREGRVEQLPTPKPGKPLPEREALVLLLRDAEGRILLQRRPATGVWAQLWSVPEAEGHAQAREWFAAHIAGDYDAAEPLAPVAHGFTHYRLLLQPMHWREVAARAAVADNGDLRWVAPHEFDSLGIPAPIRKLIRMEPSR